ncbi:hypothetical protein, partial [Escherichia coli]|uniref:hypothetical protein n=1 Tax=Escherichia coli TaxID=562 RepID=UPI001F4BA2E8
VGAWGCHKIGHHFSLPVSAVLPIPGAGSVGYDVKVRFFADVAAVSAQITINPRCFGKNRVISG